MIIVDHSFWKKDDAQNMKGVILMFITFSLFFILSKKSLTCLNVKQYFNLEKYHIKTGHPNMVYINGFGYRHPGSHIPVSYLDGSNPISFPYATGVIISYGLVRCSMDRENCYSYLCHCALSWFFCASGLYSYTSGLVLSGFLNSVLYCPKSITLCMNSNLNFAIQDFCVVAPYLPSFLFFPSF